MNVKELKELIELYEAVKDSNISIQELIHYLKHLNK